MDFGNETKEGEDNNYEEVDRQVNNAYKKRQEKKHTKVASPDSEFLDEVMEVKVINKIVLGKVMVKYCGNEGTQNDARTASLRKQLQAVIDFIQSDTKKTNWQDAEITVYDLDDNSFRIISGDGKHQYVVSDDENGKPEIVNTSNKVNKSRKLKEKNPLQNGYQSGSANMNTEGDNNNYDEVEQQVNNAYRNRQEKMHARDSSADSEFLDEVIEVNVINKRVLGKVMVKYCGNEGTQNDARTSSLRKLLQAVIDFLQNDAKKINWLNAEITVYDLDDNSFRIISGEGKHQYVVSDAENGEPEIVNTSNKVNKTRQSKEKIPPQSGYPSAKRHHRQANEGLHNNLHYKHTKHGAQQHGPRCHHDNDGKQGACLIC